MEYYSCENCAYRDDKICLYYSKKVQIFIDGKKEIKGTFLNIEKDWFCKKHSPAIPIDSVNELKILLDKVFD